MQSFREKVGQASCPNCGAYDWSVTTDTVHDQSMLAQLAYVADKAKHEDKDLSVYIDHVMVREIIFVFCFSCGYTMNANLAK